MLLVAQLMCLFLLNGTRLHLQLQLLAVSDLSEEPPGLTSVIWDVALADMCARCGLLLAKVLLALAVPASSELRH